MSYDKSLSIFSPEGTISQVDYAYEASKKGGLSVGLIGKDLVIKDTPSNVVISNEFNLLPNITSQNIKFAYTAISLDDNYKNKLGKERIHIKKDNLK